MDARITKQRLANFLSYDWLKILLAVALAVAALSVFFTTVRTRPRDEQVFTVYAYTDLLSGDDSMTFADELMRQGVFSYEILDTQAEAFGSGMYANMSFSARRAAGEGTVMFIGNAPEDDGDEETEDAGRLETFVRGALIKGELETLLDPQVYLQSAGKYLARFYGENWRDGGEFDPQKVSESFYARNGKDKRFKSKAQKENGVKEEGERLEKLRKDLLFVEEKFEDGTLTFTTVEADGKSFVAGINVGKLAGITDLYYYKETEGENTKKGKQQLNLVLFNNSTRSEDLVYETVSFLGWLVRSYGTSV